MEKKLKKDFKERQRARIEKERLQSNSSMGVIDAAATADAAMAGSGTWRASALSSLDRKSVV